MGGHMINARIALFGPLYGPIFGKALLNELVCKFDKMDDIISWYVFILFINVLYTSTKF